MQIVEGAQRKHHLIVVAVLASAKGLFALVQHANHRVQAGLDSHLFADGVFVAEQLLPRVVAKNADVRAALVFIVGKHASPQERQIRHVGRLRGCAGQNGPGHFFAVVLHAHRAHAEDTRMLETSIHGGHMRQLAQLHHVVEGQLFARQLLQCRTHADHWHMKHPDHI